MKTAKPYRRYKADPVLIASTGREIPAAAPDKKPTTQGKATLARLRDLIGQRMNRIMVHADELETTGTGIQAAAAFIVRDGHPLFSNVQFVAAIDPENSHRIVLSPLVSGKAYLRPAPAEEAISARTRHALEVLAEKVQPRKLSPADDPFDLTGVVRYDMLGITSADLLSALRIIARDGFDGEPVQIWRFDKSAFYYRIELAQPVASAPVEPPKPLPLARVSEPRAVAPEPPRKGLLARWLGW